MLRKLISRWSQLTPKERIAVFSLVFGWLVFMSGLLGLVWWTRTQSGKVEVQAQVQAEAPSTDSSRSGELIIEVAGAVQAPGVYVLKSGDRVTDALSKAGYFSDKADYVFVVTQLNQAKELKDGEKLYIPFYGEQAIGQSSSGGRSGEGISINTAPKEALEELPGIGSKRAEDIISGRPYDSIDELVSKKVITETMLQDLLTVISI